MKTNKRSKWCAVLMIAFCVTVRAQTPEQEKDFLTKVESTIRSKDTNAFLALYCWDRVDEFTRNMLKEDAEEVLTQPFSKAELLPIGDKSVLGGYTLHDVTYSPNIEPLKTLKIFYANNTGVTSGETQVGLKNGKLMLVAAAASTNLSQAKVDLKDDGLDYSKLMIQSKQGTFTLPYFEMIARQYLQKRHIAVNDGQPITDIYVCDPTKMALVKFFEGANSIRAVEIGPEAKAIRDYEIKLAK